MRLKPLPSSLLLLTVEGATLRLLVCWRCCCCWCRRLCGVVMGLWNLRAGHRETGL